MIRKSFVMSVHPGREAEEGDFEPIDKGLQPEPHLKNLQEAALLRMLKGGYISKVLYDEVMTHASGLDPFLS